MDFEAIKKTFSNRNLIDQYKQAVSAVGLWQSETMLVQQYFMPEFSLLVTGAGAGRVAFGLWNKGFKHIHAVDLCAQMADAFHEINRQRNTAIIYHVANAIELPFEDGLFNGIIMPYNVLMHIPKHINRLRALQEARRVLKKGGTLIFSTHEDRDASPKFQQFWKDEKYQWDNGHHDKRKHEFGDVIVEDKSAFIYLHIPKAPEVKDALEKTGFRLIHTATRAEIAAENEAVTQFSMDCRFWIAEAV